MEKQQVQLLNKTPISNVVLRWPVLTSRITLLNSAEKDNFIFWYQRPVEADIAAKRSTLAFLSPMVGFFLAQVSGCTIQLISYWNTANISFQCLLFSKTILLQSCIKPHHLKHFKEDLHHSRYSDMKVTAFLA